MTLTEGYVILKSGRHDNLNRVVRIPVKWLYYLWKVGKSMFHIFNKDRGNEKDRENDQKKNNIVVLKKTKPGMCGGTDATLDTDAPKEILSQDMILFDVTSALHTKPSQDSYEELINYVSAFAIKTKEGTFMLLEKRMGYQRRGNGSFSWVLVKENVFPKLVELVRECELAKNNGFHSRTHGLPENFGGSVNIKYASGENISFSNNQTPILSFDAGQKIAELFEDAMKGEKVPLPDLAALTEIRFLEERKDGGFTKATLKFHRDGTGLNIKSAKYDTDKIYESENMVDAETIHQIKNNIEVNGILAWSGLPETEYHYSEKKSMTFVFGDQEEVTVESGRSLPVQIDRGFFNIELEMTTKH